MFTVCSKCNLRLTVTATDLRAAQGYVRCGRCHNVFNALAALADDPGRETQTEGTAAATQSRPVLTLPEPPPTQPEPAAPDKAEDLVATDSSLEFNPASTNINEVFIEAAPEGRTGTFESIILIGEDPSGSDPPQDTYPVIAPAAPAPDPEASAAVEAAPEDEIPYMTTWSAAPVTPAEEGFAVNDFAATEIAGALQEAEPAAISPEPEPAGTASAAAEEGSDRAAPRVPRWALRGAAAALGLCLLAQLVHHYREPLVDTPLLHRPLTAIYRALGQPLEPRWDIARYEIRQLGATSDGAAAGDLVVRASISNRAGRDQPLPLLRVVMQDRFGNRIAARDLRPAEYLGRGAPQVTLMAPEQRVDVQVAFRDPGQAATGFEIDACMAGHAGVITCANDPGGH